MPGRQLRDQLLFLHEGIQIVQQTDVSWTLLRKLASILLDLLLDLN